MNIFSRTLALAFVFCYGSMVNATSFIFSDTPVSSTLVSESATFTSSVNYAGLDGPVSVAILTIFLSDDSSSTLGSGFVDVPQDVAQLTSVTGSLGSLSPLLMAEVDGNTISGGGITFDNVVSPTPGTIGSYFNFDVSAILGGTSGVVSFDLEALDIFSAFPTGLPYIEDFNYEGAELTIDTSPVPVPSAIWLLTTALLGLFGFSKKRTV